MSPLFMQHTQSYHSQFTALIAQKKWDAAEELWMNLTDELAGQPEALLVLLHDLARAAQPQRAANLAALLAPTLRDNGKHHEWLFALKLQSEAKHPDQSLRSELIEAYQAIYKDDARLPAILAVSDLGNPRVPLAQAIARVDTLLALQVGSYCRQKSWGYGKVKSFDTALQRLIVSFPHNPDHAFQMGYAADCLTPVSADHIEVRKQTDLESLKKLARETPLELLRLVLLGQNRAATADQIETCLSGSVIPADQWKKWWDNARKLLKRDPHFELPARKTDPVVLRAAPVSQQDELLEAFRSGTALSQRVEIARQLLKVISEIESPELLVQEFQDGLLEAIRGFKLNRPAELIEAIHTLDQVRSCSQTPPEPTLPLLLDALNRVSDLPGVLDMLSAGAQKFVIGAVKANQPDLLTQNLNRLSAKALDEIRDLLPGCALPIEQRIRNQTASPDLLIHVAKSLAAHPPPAWAATPPQPMILQAMLVACDSSHKSAKKLRELLLKDDSLLTDLLVNADTQTVRNIGRAILSNPAFEELDRRSLMGRLVKEFPFVQELLVTKSSQAQPLIVSWRSFERRRAELDEIIQKRIPHNSRDIAQARSYGDLRENFEFKAAKEAQRLLMRQRAELELLLARATPTDFSDVKTDTAQIGTTVTVRVLETGARQVFHILGAWDGNPDRHILSYPAALAQALLGKKPGEDVEWEDDTHRQRYRIEQIEKVSPDILNAL